MKNLFTILRRFLDCALVTKKREAKRFFYIAVLNAMAAFLEGISFLFVLFALATLVGNGHEATPHFLNAYFESFNTHGLFLCAILSQIFRSSIHYLAQMSMTKMAAEMQSTLQSRIYQQIFRFSYRYVSQYKTGDLVEYVNAPVHVTNGVMDALNRATVALLLMITSLTMMFLLSASLTCFCIILFLIAAFVQKAILKKIMHASSKHANVVVELGKDGAQTIYGIKSLHLHNGQLRAFSRIHEILRRITGATQRVNLWYHFILPLNETLGVLLMGIALIAGVYLLKVNTLLALPLLLTFLTLIYRFSTRLQIFIGSIGFLSTCKGQLDRIITILSDEQKEFTKEYGCEFKQFDSTITFHNVSLRYPNKEERAVKNLSLHIKKGGVTAFVGPSGAGKTSVLELLARLYDPTQGQISVDGVSLYDYSPTSWRKQLGIVSQDAMIFNESIAENIRFGDATISHKKIEDAAVFVGMHEMILSLPNQYETILGERGYRLSGGERQRLAFARALARDPQILILDEATSSLDSQAEAEIQKRLELLRGEKTLILVAHRLSTVMFADTIYVLQGGEIVEAGKHEELIEKNGIYAHLWDFQTRLITV